MLYYHMLRAHLAEICIDRALRFFVFFTTLLVFIPSLSAGSANTSLLSAPSQVRTPALYSLSLLLFFVQLHLFKFMSLHKCWKMQTQKFSELLDCVIHNWRKPDLLCYPACQEIFCSGHNLNLFGLPTAKFAFLRCELLLQPLAFFCNRLWSFFRHTTNIFNRHHKLKNKIKMWCCFSIFLANIPTAAGVITSSHEFIVTTSVTFTVSSVDMPVKVKAKTFSPPAAFTFAPVHVDLKATLGYASNVVAISPLPVMQQGEDIVTFLKAVSHSYEISFCPLFLEELQSFSGNADELRQRYEHEDYTTSSSSYMLLPLETTYHALHPPNFSKHLTRFVPRDQLPMMAAFVHRATIQPSSSGSKAFSRTFTFTAIPKRASTYVGLKPILRLHQIDSCDQDAIVDILASVRAVVYAVFASRSQTHPDLKDSCLFLLGSFRFNRALSGKSADYYVEKGIDILIPEDDPLTGTLQSILSDLFPASRMINVGGYRLKSRANPRDMKFDHSDAPRGQHPPIPDPHFTVVGVPLALPLGYVAHLLSTCVSTAELVNVGYTWRIGDYSSPNADEPAIRVNIRSAALAAYIQAFPEVLRETEAFRILGESHGVEALEIHIPRGLITRHTRMASSLPGPGSPNSLDTHNGLASQLHSETHNVLGKELDYEGLGRVLRSSPMKAAPSTPVRPPRSRIFKQDLPTSASSHKVQTPSGGLPDKGGRSLLHSPGSPSSLPPPPDGAHNLEELADRSRHLKDGESGEGPLGLSSIENASRIVEVVLAELAADNAAGIRMCLGALCHALQPPPSSELDTNMEVAVQQPSPQVFQTLKRLRSSLTPPRSFGQTEEEDAHL